MKNFQREEHARDYPSKWPHSHHLDSPIVDILNRSCFKGGCLPLHSRRLGEKKKAKSRAAEGTAKGMAEMWSFSRFGHGRGVTKTTEIWKRFS